MIHAQSLTKRFGRLTAVDDVSFEVAQGRVIGFLGPNGAGKSTTLRMLAGYLPPTSGRLTVAGHDVIRASRKARASIGYLPESTPLYPEMRVIEYLRFRARLFAVPRRERSSAIDMVIRRCWLNQERRRLIGQLSKGYRQRVGLAAAMLHRPPVLLLDEPSSGLDPTQIREMRALIRELADSHTVLLSTHILPEVEMICDGVIIIAGGRIRVQGTLDEVRAQAAEETRYVVETDLAAARIEPLLGDIRGVRSIRTRSTDDGWRRCDLLFDSRTDDQREPIARRLAGAGAVVRELRREMPSLEEVFFDAAGVAAGEGQVPFDDASQDDSTGRSGVEPKTGDRHKEVAA